MSKTKINTNIAKKLGMLVPDTSDDDSTPANLVTVDPHEIRPVKNEDLPDMTDEELALKEGQKQLELIINKSMKIVNEQYSETQNIEPKFRNRHIEMIATVLATCLDGVKHKTELQIKSKQQKLKEQSYSKESASKGKLTTNYNFYGSREELRKLMAKAKSGEGMEEPSDE